MTKVVKAFSVDPDVARYIDEFPAGTRSEHVNWALRSYFFSKYGEQIEYWKDAESYWRKKHLESIDKQGVKHHLVGLFRALFPFGKR